MAQSKPALLDYPMCPICVDVLRDPVSLPCAHTCCRGCIGMVAEGSDSIPDTGSSDPTPRAISCPVCHEQTHLDAKGVSGLPTNTAVARALGELHVGESHSQPLCLMCEGDDKSTATNACSTCSILYCESCFTVMHPMRGPLKDHILLSVDDYLSAKREGSGNDEDRKPVTTCSLHQESFSEYCLTCQQLLCSHCLNDHNKHNVADIASAFDTLKKALEGKLDACENVTVAILTKVSETDELKNKFKENENKQVEEVKKAYMDALGVLNMWQANLIRPVTDRYQESYQRMDVVRHNLGMNFDKVTQIKEAVKELSSTEAIQFLQDANKLTPRCVDMRLNTVSKALGKQNYESANSGTGENLHPIRPKKLRIVEDFGGKPLSATRLSFSVSKGLEKSEISTFTFSSNHWRANVELTTGRHFWKLSVRIRSPQTTPTTSTLKMGVLLGGYNFGFSENCWGIKFEYYAGGYRFCAADQSKAVFHRPMKHPYPHSIGLYLDCDKGTMYVIDCNDNSLISSLEDLPIHKPLTPACEYNERCFEVVSESCDCSCLPQVLREILELEVI